VLAAGASQRMGRNKMFLEIDGETLLARAVRVAQEAGLHPVVVVAGADPQRVAHALTGAGCDVVLNRNPGGLMSESLHIGLHALPPAVGGAVVLLPDMIRVTGEMVCAIVDLAEETGAPLAVSRYGEITAPPILFRRVLFPQLLGWQGEGIGKAVVNANSLYAAYLNWPAKMLQDVDTEEDWQRISWQSGG
jgi:molybdenum cofactor cytidylyltransferase